MFLTFNRQNNKDGQLSPTVMMISGSEPIPEGTEDYVKIALMGPTDLNPANDSWQSKFAQGVAAITSTEAW